MDRVERAMALRADEHKHCNCCQAVLIPFAAACGMGEEQAEALGAHFGGGMRHGSTCGAVTGGLMVLGLLDKGEDMAKEFMRRFKEKNALLDCAHLLKAAVEAGEERKPHCDRMVADSIELLEELLGQ